MSFAALAPAHLAEPRAQPLADSNTVMAKSESCWAGLAASCGFSFLGARVCDLLGVGKCDGSSAGNPRKAAKRRSWYAVRQQHGSDLFVVQAVPGPDGDHVPCAESGVGIRRTKSFSTDTSSVEQSMCQICCAEPADAVMLPCRHGDICSSCVRRAMFMRPLHRGGGSCPLCRRKIKQVVQIEREVDAPSVLPRRGAALTSWGRAC